MEKSTIKVVAEITPIPAHAKDGCYVPAEFCIDSRDSSIPYIWATGSTEREAIKNFLKTAKQTLKKDWIDLVLGSDVREIKG